MYIFFRNFTSFPFITDFIFQKQRHNALIFRSNNSICIEIIFDSINVHKGTNSFQIVFRKVTIFFKNGYFTAETE